MPTCLCVRPAVVAPASVWPLVAWCQPRDAGHFGPHMMWGGWYGMFFGPLAMIVSIAVIVVLIVLAVRWPGGGRGPSRPLPPKEIAFDILPHSLKQR